MHCGWQLREDAHPKACQVAGSCELLFCPHARRNSSASTQSLFTINLLWLTQFPFSLPLLGFLSQHCREIIPLCTADRWDSLFIYLIELPKPVPPCTVTCLLISVLPPWTRGFPEHNRWQIEQTNPTHFGIFARHFPPPISSKVINQFQ